MAQSSIEWTDAVWNPVTGCTKVSQGCKHCYAERMAKRLAGRLGYPAADPFRVTLHPDRLDLPLRWKRRRRIFVNSMSDLFHPDVPEAFIRDVWAIMAQAHQHTFQVLTKRPERMAEVLHRMDLQDLAPPRPLPNVWVGVSVEDQGTADERIPHLLRTPAAVRWISAEPLLGPLDVRRYLRPQRLCEGHASWECEDTCLYLPALDWVVAGGESGPGARPMHPDWARILRDRCKAAGVAFMLKQWGEWCGGTFSHDSESDLAVHAHNGETYDLNEMFGSDAEAKRDAWVQSRYHGISVSSAWADPLTLYSGECCVRVGKKAAGRLLDGRTWDEYPEVHHA